MKRFLNTFASFLSLVVPSVAGAEVVARATACGPEVRLERAADGEVTLVGAGQPVPLHVGTASFESVTLAHGTMLIARNTNDHAPVAAAVVRCRPPAAPEVVWHGATQWTGEDIGSQTRHVLLVEGAPTARRLVLAVQDQSLEVAPGVFPLLHIQDFDAATGAWTTATRDPLALPDQHVPAGQALTAVRGAETPAVVPTATHVDENGTVLIGAVRAGGLAARGIELVPAANTTLPRHLRLFTEPGDHAYDVQIPAELTHAARVLLPLASDATVRRYALVSIDGASLHTASTALRTSLDDAGVDPLARLVELAAQPEGDDAAALLIAMRERGVAAILQALPHWHGVAVRRALRLLGPMPYPGVPEALVAALGDRELAPIALSALRQQGERALGALSSAAAENPHAVDAIRALSAPVESKLHAVLSVLGTDDRVWRAARPAVGGLLHLAVTPAQVTAWLTMLPNDPRSASRGLVLSAHEFSAPETRALVAARAMNVWTTTEDFADRYRLLPALAGDTAGRAILAQVATTDHDIDLRAEAVRVLGTTEGSTPTLLQALGDRAPRVRAAAAGALPSSDATRSALVTALTRDEWPTVRAAAAGALAGDPGATHALLDAIEQPSVPVVEAALRSLGAMPVATDGVSAHLVSFVNDTRRNPDLRREAADAVGARCDASVSADMERIVDSLSEPALPPTEQEVGHAAMAALARIDPVRARAFLHRAGSNAQAVAAVEVAIRTGCHPPPPTHSGNP